MTRRTSSGPSAPESRGAGETGRRRAEAIRAAFESYRAEFDGITRRARVRFEQRDWGGMQADAVARLDLYGRVVARLVADLHQALGARIQDRPLWARIRDAYSASVAGSPNLELAETFFNSVTRHVFSTVGVDPAIEYVATDFERSESGPTEPIHREVRGSGFTLEAVSRVLASLPFRSPWDDRSRDARRVAHAVEARCREAWGGPSFDAVEVLRPVFFRRKGAYVFGRVRSGARGFPLVLALLNGERGIAVDAVLLTEDEASIVLSFTRSYFHVEAEVPRPVVRFLQSIVPRKPVAELYIAIGHNKHGKTEMYRSLLRSLETSTDRFVPAPGEAGLVMTVFTLPSHDVVFKVIRDRFAPPKTTTRQEVMDKYRLVFRHDRAGRLVDAQEFEHLAFARERFSDGLLAELLTSAAESVHVEGDVVSIRHLYAERRVTPLNLYLAAADPTARREAILDYGQTVRDLAATNIFPGDLLLKNFGVTRHGRVIFYDYDELCLLTDCSFRDLPGPRDVDEEMSAEPWFYVAPNDVFPEEFLTFMGFEGDLRDAFLRAHGEILTAAFWRRMQRQIRAGELVDIFPYRAGRRLSPEA